MSINYNELLAAKARMTAELQPRQEFVRFFSQIEKQVPADFDVHLAAIAAVNVSPPAQDGGEPEYLISPLSSARPRR